MLSRVARARLFVRQMSEAPKPTPNIASDTSKNESDVVVRIAEVVAKVMKSDSQKWLVGGIAAATAATASMIYNSVSYFNKEIVGP